LRRLYGLDVDKRELEKLLAGIAQHLEEGAVIAVWPLPKVADPHGAAPLAVGGDIGALLAGARSWKALRAVRAALQYDAGGSDLQALPSLPDEIHRLI
jgi:hypothetical protein